MSKNSSKPKRQHVTVKVEVILPGGRRSIRTLQVSPDKVTNSETLGKLCADQGVQLASIPSD